MDSILIFLAQPISIHNVFPRILDDSTSWRCCPFHNHVCEYKCSFSADKTLPGHSPTDIKTRERQGEGDRPSLLLIDSRRIECLRWAGKLKSPLLKRARHVVLLPDCLMVLGLEPDVQCTPKWTESPTHVRTLSSLKYACLLHFDPTFLLLPPPFLYEIL